jgi:2-polyprenyl-3-methyl-5-hydroxy-6-metoxy-1,4-benzoquinol methylase
MDINFTTKTKRDLYRQQLEKELAELIDPDTGIVSAKYTEYVPCPLCGEPKTHRILFVVKGFPHVKCQKCGLIFTNPQVNEQNLNELYKHSKANDLWLDVLMSEAESKDRYILYERYFDLLGRYTAYRSLVDVGCSIGDLLVVAQRRGWNAQGFDLSEKAISFARDVRKLNVRLGVLEDVGFQEKTLSVVTLTGVLEHLNNPLDILRKIREFLVQDGRILIQVPNIHSLHNMVLHEKSTSFDGRNHLIFFTPKTLLQVLERAGYKIMHMGTYQGVTHVLCRYLQYFDPYNGEADFEYLPEKIRPWFEDSRKHMKLIKWLETMGMGRCIMAIAAKQ